MKTIEISNNNSGKQYIGAFALTMIAIGAIVSVRTIPEIAVYGVSCILTIVLASSIFMIPIVIASLELSIAFPKGGGMYTWAKEIFNKKIGFFEAYVELAINVILMVIILCFICGNILYLIDTNLSNNKLIIFILGTIIFSIITYINCNGLKLSSTISSICTILGVFLPIMIIILFGIKNFISNPHAINYSISNMIPAWKTFDYWTSLSSVALGFSGLEVIVVHVRNVRNVKRDYTISLITLAIIATILYIIAPLSVAMVVPKEEILFSSGIAQVIKIFFDNVGMGYMTPIIIILTCIGALGSLNSWTISAVKPLWVASEDGLCHKMFNKTNKHNAPITLLILQLVMVIMLFTLIMFVPTANDFFWIFTVLCCQNAVLVYIIIFPTHIKFTISRNINIFSKIWRIKSSIAGIAICLFTFFIGFLPNPIISLAKNKPLYFMIILIGLILSWVPAILLYLSGSKKISNKIN